MIATLQESSAFRVFMERVAEKAQEYHTVLGSETDPALLYRAQGALQFALFVQELPETLRSESAQAHAEAGQDSSDDYERW